MENLVDWGASSFVVESADQDIIKGLIGDKRSLNTKREYEKDLLDFFATMTRQPAANDVVKSFLGLNRGQALATVLKYKAQLIEKGLKEATVNRRLAALRSLANYARKTGLCEWDLNDVSGEKVITYRDTSGIGTEQMRIVLAVPDRQTLKGKRDYAILRLLWDNALREGEIVKADIADFDPGAATLAILGKGKGSQKQIIGLNEITCAAIGEWLTARNEFDKRQPLFIALDNASKGHRIMGTGVYKLVQTLTVRAGIEKRMSPHRFRHSAITVALEATNGNVVLVQKLSWHSKIETLMIYEDARENRQRKVSDLLAALVPE